MAINTLIGKTEINGEKILQERPKYEDGTVNWSLFDELRKDYPIFIDHDVNMISFRIQDGPILENGKNGCQLDALIATAKHMIEELNKKFSCRENSMAITKLDEALLWLEKRKSDRIKRG